MKIAVTSSGATMDSPLDVRFGRAAWFMVHDTDSGTWEAIQNDQNLNLPQGAGIQSASTVVNAGCQILISAHCGPKAFDVLKKGLVQIFLAADGTAKQCVEKYKRGGLRELANADVEGHW